MILSDFEINLVLFSCDKRKLLQYLLHTYSKSKSVYIIYKIPQTSNVFATVFVWENGRKS